MGNQDPQLRNLTMRTENSLETVNEIDDMVGTISSMTTKLKQHPNPQAYSALVKALNEVVKTWEVTNEAFKEVWQLYKANGDLKDAAEGLLDISDFQLRSKVQQGRGHCHIIGEIYFLENRDWFKQALSDEDQQTMEQIFRYLGEADVDVFQQMERFAAETETAANRVLDLVQSNQPEEARKVAGALLQTIRPLRTDINRSLVSLRHVQSEFTTLSAVPRPVAAAAPAFWTGELAKEFHDCLLDGYNYDSAEQMLKFELSKRLDELVAPGGFRDVAFDLIQVAEEEGWIIDLVQAAHTANPTNQQLADFTHKVEGLQAT